MSLVGKTPSNSFKDLLHVDNSNNGLTTSDKRVKSGDGTSSCLSLSDDVLHVQPQNDDTGSAVRVNSKDNTARFVVDTDTPAVKALGQYVNTNIKQFMFSSVNAHPSSTNWTMLDSIGGGRFNTSPSTMGTGSTPATTLTVSTTADDLVQSIWYVPFNIAIDSCNVWFGADVSGGDTVKFSIMSYTIDSANGSTGGDLSAGAEHCASGSTIAGAGYEQAYYQALTVSSANVDAGKVITANVLQDGTSSDLTVNLQLVYHLRST